MRGPDYAGGDAVEDAVMAMVRKDIDDDDSASSSGSNRLDNTTAAAGSNGKHSRSSFDISTATSWPGVPAGDVLVAPHEARLAWREFMSASSLSVQQVRGAAVCGCSEHG